MGEIKRRLFELNLPQNRSAFLWGPRKVCPWTIFLEKLWEESGRGPIYGKELLRLQDRHGRPYCYGPTHEEVITAMVRGSVRSYKDLPLNLYQIQTKFRDEIRPRFGLMRGREFVMKDAYSFHATKEDLDQTYQKMYAAYERILERIGLDYTVVEADSGAIGGSLSHEFMVLADTGEAELLCCTECAYAVNQEAASDYLGPAIQEELPGQKEKISTPAIKTIEELSKFFKVEPHKIFKSILYLINEEPVLIMIRGDYQVSLTKLHKIFGFDAQIIAADAQTITEITATEAGFMGPINLKQKIKIIADHSIAHQKIGIIGANETDYHYQNVVFAQDFTADAIYD
ncbi:prolyl-tRNA synthetase, partial [Candidatus Magnetomorum sp. HK-1]